MNRASLASQNAQLRRTVMRLSEELAAARFAATHDALTGLLNRAGLAALWPMLEPRGVLLVDLDGFKPINDYRGHLAGDVVLQVIGSRLAAAQGVVAARFGGDEFVLVLTEGTDPVRCAYRTVEMIHDPIRLPDGSEVRVAASIGVASVPTPVMYEAIERADRAMYAAKATSEPVVVFKSDLSDVPAGMRRRDAAARAQVVAQRR